MKKTWRFWFIGAVLLMDVLLTAACNASWITEANSIVAAMIPAALNILALIAAFSGSTVTPTAVAEVEAVGTKIQNGLTLLGELISSYTAANATTVLGEINAAIADVKANLAQILPLLNVTDPATLAKINAVIGVVEAELQSLEALIPLIQTPPASTEEFKAAIASSKLLTAKQFHVAFVKAFTAPTGDVHVDEVVAKVVAEGKL